MARKARLHNPYLTAVNPFTKTRKRRNPKRKSTAAKSKRRNPSRVARRNPFDVMGIVKKGGAAGLGALATTFVANMIPLPVNPLLNAGAKALIGVGIGYGAQMLGPTKNISDYIMAGGVGVAAADGIRFLVPKLRTVIVPSEPQADALKQIAPGELNDVVVADGFGDVVDTMNYDSAWAAQ